MKIESTFFGRSAAHYIYTRHPRIKNVNEALDLAADRIWKRMCSTLAHISGTELPNGKADRIKELSQALISSRKQYLIFSTLAICSLTAGLALVTLISIQILALPFVAVVAALGFATLLLGIKAHSCHQKFKKHVQTVVENSIVDQVELQTWTGEDTHLDNGPPSPQLIPIDHSTSDDSL